MNDQQTDFRALRRAYRKAIAATDAASAACGSDLPYNQLLKARHVHEGARDDEQLAGRAFLAALDVADPACRVCGCTELDPCDEGCCWVHKPGEPPLCSACADKQAVT